MTAHFTPGRTAGIAVAAEAIEPVAARPRELPAGKSHDADDLRSKLLIRGPRPVIAWRSNRRERGSLDQSRHVLRDRIERMIGFPKRFRGFDTRHDKTAAAFLSLVQLAAIRRRLRFVRTT